MSNTTIAPTTTPDRTPDATPGTIPGAAAQPATLAPALHWGGYLTLCAMWLVLTVAGIVLLAGPATMPY